MEHRDHCKALVTVDQTYQVTVGNVGQVYNGSSLHEALDISRTYIELAKQPGNRCTLVEVVFWQNDSPDVIWEPEAELSASELAHANGIEVFDTAIPLPVFKVLSELAGENVSGHVVWSYDKRPLGGDPVGVTELGRETVEKLESRSRY